MTLVEMLAKMPVRPISSHGVMLHRRLGAAGVKLLLNTRVIRIEEGAVHVSTEGKDQRLEPVNQVVVAVGVTPRQDLKEMLDRENIRHFIIGDAKEPRRIIEATEEGASAAWAI
ncbi:MAG: FAD-dependent oxidoreductase [Deltaproteobacteria bacterium]|nr:FAD-dependent oxidoreductase [Deltaproteobacteria bacterium]